MSRIPGISRAASVSIVTWALLFLGASRFAAAADDTGSAPTQESRGAKKAAKGTKHSTKVEETKSEETRADVPAADNTATNRRDCEKGEKTADQQKNDKSDVELAAEIRRAVMADKSLSTNAHNAKIIVENGQVTLKGPVASSAEKATLERKAVEAVGRGGRVTNELQLAP